MRDLLFVGITQKKYRIVGEYRHDVRIPADKLSQAIPEDFYLQLDKHGVLTVRNGYEYDGASGPTIDTPNSLRAALVHDALYELMRRQFLPLTWRLHADKLLFEICREDGMIRARAWAWYRMVRRFGEKFAAPREAPRVHRVRVDDAGWTVVDR